MRYLAITISQQKPIEILNGHFDPFNMDINKLLIINYLEQHRQRTKLLDEQLNKLSSETKQKTIENVTRPCNLQSRNKSLYKN